MTTLLCLSIQWGRISNPFLVGDQLQSYIAAPGSRTSLSPDCRNHRHHWVFGAKVAPKRAAPCCFVSI